jgi:hypothetical protein
MSLAGAETAQAILDEAFNRVVTRHLIRRIVTRWFPQVNDRDGRPPNASPDPAGWSQISTLCNYAPWPMGATPATCNRYGSASAASN